MPEGHFAGLREYTDDAARQPDFEVIRRRAGRVRRRRRNAAASVVAGLTAAVVAAVGLTTGPGDGQQPAATPTPTPSVDMNAGWPRWTDVVAAKADELYAVSERCRTCGPELHVSADAGRTWSRRAVPPSTTPGADIRPSGFLDAVAPGVLLWSDRLIVTIPESGATGAVDAYESFKSAYDGRTVSPEQRFWITRDGGRSWQRPGVDEQPVDAVPAGTRVVDCGMVKEETPCRLYAVNPETGRFAPLANQPTGVRYAQGWLGHQVDVPVSGRLWVPGLDPASNKPAIAASPDGGRTWTTHVFTDGVPAQDTLRFVATMYLPAVAAGDGATAYVLTYRTDLKHDAYRTTDGGVTWERVPGGPIPEVPDAGYVTADGAHVVKNGSDFRVFRPGAGGYAPVTLSGYPADVRRLTQVTSQQATGRYVVTSGEVLSVSDDGWTWRTVDMP
ncbi:WD40/YVTN/BNR-like repeat-containing protein [Virgisporangium aurantiacum]|uniref:BNR/Asp-box repeat-containing protein n=1 Tax=Virgisporangium aurantiacum TaxID=175570 RepID=A0A8J4E2V5_9ACTN|nr:hypothetical protein [Virgisporangium aurantiacum]GIJ60235.1 hypothetical protein Vau01_077510 [Virgisporangium aurantiacum]